MKSLDKKVVLITGAAGGFGQEFTKQLLEQGAYLILTDIHEEVLKDISVNIIKNTTANKGKILGVFGSDISSKQGCLEAFEKALAIHAEIDILINNAGLINYGNFHEIPLSNWERLMMVNLMAPMCLSYEFLNKYNNRKSGHILNISSVSGFIATAHAVPYSASKFGIRGFGMALHKEAQSMRIHVTNVYPFYSPTPLLNTATSGSAATQQVPKFLYSTPKTIVKSAIKGLRKNKLHVYPGLVSGILFNATRFFPIVGNMNK